MDYRCILRINNDVTFIDSNTLQATWCRPSRYHLMSTECTNCTNNFNITTRTSCVFFFFFLVNTSTNSQPFIRASHYRGMCSTLSCFTAWLALFNLSQVLFPTSRSFCKHVQNNAKPAFSLMANLAHGQCCGFTRPRQNFYFQPVISVQTDIRNPAENDNW